jgi:hypothetical protein
MTPLAFPKPKDQKRRKLNPVIIFPDGREVCNMQSAAGRAEYERRKDVMHRRQNSRCILCGKHLERVRASFEHEDGKGMNSSHRDDRIWKVDPVTGERKSYNGVAHGWCNGRKGSKRGLDHSLVEGPDFGRRGVLSAAAVGAGRSSHRCNRAAGTAPLGNRRGLSGRHQW